MSSPMIWKTRNNPQYQQNVECLVPSGAQKTNKEIGHREAWDGNRIYANEQHLAF